MHAGKGVSKVRGRKERFEFSSGEVNISEIANTRNTYDYHSGYYNVPDAWCAGRLFCARPKVVLLYTYSPTLVYTHHVVLFSGPRLAACTIHYTRLIMMIISSDAICISRLRRAA